MRDEIVEIDPLDATHRDVLVVLALSDTNAPNRTVWQDLVRRAGIANVRGGAIHGDSFDVIVEELVAAGAVTLTARRDYVLSGAWIAPLLTDAAKRDRLLPLWTSVGEVRRGSYMAQSESVGAARVAFASGSSRRIDEANLNLKSQLLYADPRYAEQSAVLLRVLGSQPPASWIDALDPLLRETYLRDLCDHGFRKMGAIGKDALEAISTAEIPAIRAQAAILFALAGNPERSRELVSASSSSTWDRGALAFLALTEGAHEEARNRFTAATTGKRGQHGEMPGTLAVFDLLLAATSDRAEDLHQLPARMLRCKRQLSIFFGARSAIEDLATFRMTTQARGFTPDATTWIDALVVGLVQQWTHRRFSVGADLTRHAVTAKKNGYAWIAAELERVTKGLKKGSLLGLLGSKESWELALDAMTSASTAASDATATRATRDDADLWWELGIFMGSIQADAYLVTRRSGKGKKVSLAQLRSGSTILADQDRRILQALENPKSRTFTAPPLSALLTFVGHPRVRNAAGLTLAIRRSEPTLRVEETTNGARITSFPSTFDADGVAVIDDRAGVVTVFVRSQQASRILAVVPQGGLTIPKDGLSRMSEVLGGLSSVLTVEASAGLTSETIAADPRINIQLFRAGGGLRIRLRVVPGGNTGPALRPGVPPLELVIHSDGLLKRVTRDLDDERVRVERLLEACPILAALEQDGDDRIASELATCLELMIELENKASEAVIAWPAGQPLRAPNVRSASDVRVRVNGSTSWLTIEGEVQVDENRVVDMRELLAAASRGTGRFVPIGPDEWIALTEELRLKLEGLQRLEGLAMAGGKMSAALLPTVDDLVDGLDATFAKDLVSLRKKLKNAADVTFAVPADLKTDLRDYQREGFEFLARRTAVGLGACLADDMGLGKTVQALALLLLRKNEGPALVVAPTSVCRNWEAETARFAPSLKIKRFGDENRKATIDGAKAGDVVVMSYALLVAEEAIVAGRTWGTVVYDEAHALKNASTKRWNAAHALASNTSIALTGTPVENRVGELHAVLDLLVPGMLGSRNAFERVFGGPMAEGDHQSAAQLRQLVRPFVLRRSKTQVLSELPPKTEIVRVVTPTPEHRAFYEAVRRRAIDQMTAARVADRSSANRARMQLLAEITRLRRSAIDPRLVGGDDAPAGSKIETLVELVLELRSEGRRALIFSQFLEVLDLARTALEEKGITCQRLDGTMNADERSVAVEAFQGGTGDVFLLSLKAGGVGMNLTAADFVILLDPWWNPAVEDQAADRAHRIGQSRAVTVVRLVTEGTIEEKVLTLHAKKRKLYEDVVADADGQGTINIDAMAALLD
jgi:superfamily II DNA or RNA helicase